MEIKREKIIGIRKFIGSRLRESLAAFPHVTIMTTVDMTEIDRIKKEYKIKGQSLSTTAFLIKAVGVALRKYPNMNTRYENGEIVYYDEADAGIAVDSPKGLMVVTVRNVTAKSIATLTEELRGLVERVKKGTVTLDELTGSTFTVSNESMSKNDYFSSVLNNNECIIVGLARYKKQFMIDDNDNALIRLIGNIMLNFNHGLVDGMPAAAFLGEVAELLSDPEALM